MKKFNEIYEEHYNEILNYFSMKLYSSNRMVAEELTNDVFLKVNKNLESYDSDKSQLKTWIYNIAKNTFIDHCRHTNKKSKIDLISMAKNNDSEDKKIDFIDTLVSEFRADDIIHMEEVSSMVSTALNKTLRGNDIELMRLRHIEGLKMSEIASKLDMSINNVKARLHRCMKKLNKSYAI